MIFLDTSALIGAWVAADQYHEPADRGFRGLLKKRTPMATSDAVLLEVGGYFYVNAPARGSKAVIEFAADRLRHLRQWSMVTVVTATDLDQLLALDEFARFADNPISLTDCLSFTIMRRLGIRRAFTFDRHFSVAGFAVWPD